jgi:hypothetical protein
MSWIIFLEGPRLPKTRTWFVLTKEGEQGLGRIQWFSRWRKYCFFPLGDTAFEQDCLQEIASFCEQRTREHKQRPGA